MVDPSEQTLSDRETEILRLVATGVSNKEIAQQLLISPNTVKVHLRNIFAKINVTSRTEATLYAIRTGLVEGLGETAAAAPLALRAPAEDAPAPAEAAPLEALAPPRPAAPRRLGWALGLGLLVVLGLGAGGAWWRSTVSSTGTAPAAAPGVIAWSARAALPSGRGAAAVAVYEGQIYLIGGENTGGVSGRVEYYDPAGDAWHAAADKPTPAADIAAAVIGGRIFVPGGRLASGQVSAQLEIYDPRKDAWSAGVPLPVALSAYALATFEGKVYVFGGWDGARYRAETYVYHPDEDRWTTQAPMPTARGFAGAAVAGGKLYVIGGTGAAGGLNVNEVYTPDQDRAGERPWQSAPGLPEPRPAVSVVSLADTLYVSGPAGAAAAPDWSAAGKLAAYYPPAQKWEEFVAAAPGLLPAGGGLAALGSEIHSLGGRQAEGYSARHAAFQAVYTTLLPAVGK